MKPNLSPLSQLSTTLAEDMYILNQVLQRALKSDVPLINQIAAHILKVGGKRIRPLLTLGCHQLCLSFLKESTQDAKLAHESTEEAHRLAAAIELIHTATLLHDDVIDLSDQRRGEPAAHTLFGNTAAILVGDYLFSRSFELMVSCKTKGVLEKLSKASALITEGEVMQLSKSYSVTITLEDYLEIVSRKTSVLFKAACTVGGMVGLRKVRCSAPLLGMTLQESARTTDNESVKFQERPYTTDNNGSVNFQERPYTTDNYTAYNKSTLPHNETATTPSDGLDIISAIPSDGLDTIIEALDSYGHNLGAAFQILDDIYDYFPPEDFGKTPGDDFLEGKITLPIILALNKLKGSPDGDWIQAIFTENKGPFLKKSISTSFGADTDDTNPEKRAAFETFNQICTVCRAHGIPEEAIQFAENYAQKAFDALCVFPDSPIKEILQNLPLSLAKRSIQKSQTSLTHKILSTLSASLNHVFSAETNSEPQKKTTGMG